MAKKENVDFNVMEAISVLADNLKCSKLKIRRTQKFLKAEEQLNSYFAITSRGTWMLCGIIAYYFDHRGQSSSFNSLAHFFNVSVMAVAAYTDGVRELLKKRYIQNIESFDESEIGLSNEFKLSKELVSCILHNKKIYISQKNTKTDLFEKIKKIGEVIDGNDDWFEKHFEIEEAEKKFAAGSRKTFAKKSAERNCCSALQCTRDRKNGKRLSDCQGDGQSNFSRGHKQCQVMLVW